MKVTTLLNGKEVKHIDILEFSALEDPKFVSQTVPDKYGRYHTIWECGEFYYSVKCSMTEFLPSIKSVDMFD